MQKTRAYNHKKHLSIKKSFTLKGTMFFLDAHCHIYPCFSIETFFDSFFKNIREIEHQTSSIITHSGIILTETNTCNFHTALHHDSSMLEKLRKHGYERINDCFISSQDPSAPPLKIYPGRQVSSIERIEVLALFREEPLPEDLSLETLLKEIRSQNGLPVINWAPGKWSGKRRKLVESYLKHHSKEALLGLSSLLPEGFSYPKIILDGMQADIPIIYGSDPLPFKGQESLAGSYGMLFPLLQDVPPPADFARILEKPPHSSSGKRSSILNTLYRLLGNEIQRRI